MPSPRTMGMGCTLPCADQEKMVCFLVRETISSAVNVGVISIAVIVLVPLERATARHARRYCEGFRRTARECRTQNAELRITAARSKGGGFLNSAFCVLPSAFRCRAPRACHKA